jgi:hypothetical protein
VVLAIARTECSTAIRIPGISNNNGSCFFIPVRGTTSLKRPLLGRVSYDPRNEIPKILTASDPGKVALFHHMFIISMPCCNLLSYSCNLRGSVKGFFRMLSEPVAIIHQNRIILLEIGKRPAYRCNSIRNSWRAIEETWAGDSVFPSRDSESLPRPFSTPPSGLAEFRVSGKPPSSLLFGFYQGLPLSSWNRISFPGSGLGMLMRKLCLR